MENAAGRPIRKIQRKSTAGELHQIYDAISYWTSDTMRQQPTQERIQNFLKTRYGITEDSTAAILQKCVDDQLLLREMKQCTRGKLIGKMVEIYTIPPNAEREGWDWYCFVCHTKGCVTGCVSCHRVYHMDCLPDRFRSDNLKCPTCVEIEDELSSKNHNLENLNKCIGFVCERVKFFVPENLYSRKVPVGFFQKTISYQTSEDEPFRESLIFYEPMSIDRMTKKAENREYKALGQFVADANTFMHNIHAYHHGNNQFSPLPLMKQMHKALMHDADEIKNCLQCFVNSNEQPKNWYCLPCDPPHKLVFAKQKGYCYWPAKVMRKNEEGKKVRYDVRFFGSPYERALIEEAYIKPISTPLTSLSLKRTAKLNSAIEELENYKRLAKSIPPTVQVAPKSNSVDLSTASPPKKRLKTAKQQQEKTPKPVAQKKEVVAPVVEEKPAEEETANVDAKPVEEEEEEKIEPELPVETDMPPELDANRNSVTSSVSRKLTMEESSEDAVSSSNATNGEVSNANAECLEQLRQKHALEVAKLQQVHADEIKKLKEEHRLQAELMREQHRVAIEETKAKIWCCQCFGEAILYCCWQTAYCSKECQHRHWMSDHKLKCRRSR